ncbi:MAG: GNAT family N-acetyltransferase [Firmicutes bacterium]|nr:GNAT family N-acetyltransferase [Bacillota bacterium]
MNLPFLIIVTGEPGTGKTTFAKALSEKACLPLINRDQIKEGLVHTWEQNGGKQPENANLPTNELFFRLISEMLDRGCSLVAEAAFQHPLWEKNLTPLMEKAQIRICLCAPKNRELAHERFLQRGLSDERRIRFHGDKGVQMVKEGQTPVFTDYEAPHLSVPTFRVDTTDEYRPPIDELIPLILYQPDVTSVRKIETSRLVLRKAKDSDLEKIWENVWGDEELAETMLWSPAKTREDALNRLRAAKFFQGSSYSFFVCLKETDEPIGFGGIKAINPGEYEETGICISRRFQGQGYGKELLNALIQLAFERLGGHRFVYAAFHENEASIALCRSCGFVYSRSRKETRQRDGKEFLCDYYELKKTK